MTRRLRSSSPRGILSRLASFAGVLTLSSAGLLGAAPALAEVAPQTDALLIGQREEPDFSVALNGTTTLGAPETVTESLDVANEAMAGISTLTGTDGGSAIDDTIVTFLIAGDETFFVEWIVNETSLVQAEFSRTAVCDEATPSRNLVSTGFPTSTSTPSGEPTESPFTNPAPTDSPEPTSSPAELPEPSVTPMRAPTGVSEPYDRPGLSEDPIPFETPVAIPLRVSLSSASVPAAGNITVNASGFAPGEQLEVWLHSDPWRLTTATADSNGAVSMSVGIAGGTESGEHQIEVRGAKSGYVFVDVEVAGDLAITGIGSAFASGVATTGLVIVLGSVAAVLLARRAHIRAGV
ncbi:hypothetical protein ACW5CM_15080 [Microbacterium sp. A588]